MSRLLDGTMSRMTDNIQNDLRLARRVVIGKDCWSKKSLTASFLAISASFYHPSRHHPIHVLLNIQQITHPHTGDMLADKLIGTLESWGIGKSKVLMIITDNGSNMIKAVRVANTMKNEQAGSNDNENHDEDSDEEEDGTVDDNDDEDSDDEVEETDVDGSFGSCCELAQISLHGTYTAASHKRTDKESRVHKLDNQGQKLS